ncbi:MAG TPA: agmatine deiminase family protein, partial [Flavitalea sp.]|nr:agmatine deiminase family protein [Flavitalea sp.]
MKNKPTPHELGYFFPAEFAPHRATWLSWPHKEASWPGKIQTIYPRYTAFIKILTYSELVCINVNDQAMKDAAVEWLAKDGVDLSRVEFFFNPTN